MNSIQKKLNILKDINDKYLKKVIKSNKKQFCTQYPEIINFDINMYNEIYKIDLKTDSEIDSDKNELLNIKIEQIKKHFKESSKEKYNRTLGKENELIGGLILLIFKIDLYDFAEVLSETVDSEESNEINMENNNLFILIMDLYKIISTNNEHGFDNDDAIKTMFLIEDDDKNSNCSIQYKYLKYKHKYIKYKKNKLLLKNK